MEVRLDKNPIVLLELVERLGNLMRTELRRAGSDESLQPVHLQSLIYLSKANRYSNTPQAGEHFPVSAPYSVNGRA